jgi:hypothetical protein
VLTSCRSPDFISLAKIQHERFPILDRKRISGLIVFDALANQSVNACAGEPCLFAENWQWQVNLKISGKRTVNFPENFFGLQRHIHTRQFLRTLGNWP